MIYRGGGKLATKKTQTKKKTAARTPSKAAPRRSKAHSVSPAESYPAPWDLEGEGYIFPFFANREYNLKHGFLSAEDQAAYRGGLGAMMLVNYSKSNCGPYYELLYIPGNFSHPDGQCKRISRIFVSSEVSVRWGIRNWAIPKELAEFDWQKGPRSTFIEVRQGRNVFLRVRMEHGLIPFPVTTALMPFSLIQRAPDRWLKTKLSGRGRGRRTRLSEFFVNEKYYPDAMESGAGRFGIAVDPFRLQFPVAEELPLRS